MRGCEDQAAGVEFCWVGKFLGHRPRFNGAQDSFSRPATHWSHSQTMVKNGFAEVMA